MNLSVEELKEFQEIISLYEDIESLKKDVDSLIKKKEEESKKSLNVRFNRDLFVKLHIFDARELEVLDRNGISNIQELIDCSLDSLIGITSSIREKFEWARVMYNMECFEENNEIRK